MNTLHKRAATIAAIYGVFAFGVSVLVEILMTIKSPVKKVVEGMYYAGDVNI